MLQFNMSDDCLFLILFMNFDLIFVFQFAGFLYFEIDLLPIIAQSRRFSSRQVELMKLGMGSMALG